MIKNIFATLTFFGFIYLLVFCIINLFLGCQTWDQSQWTEYNSCMTFAQSIGYDKQSQRQMEKRLIKMPLL